ncbi:MAG: stage II sporulation protein P [Lachnospiraceae bacterium]|nr:stage II sporulation protein P [Lachnospiraceae bacterium]
MFVVVCMAVVMAMLGLAGVRGQVKTALNSMFEEYGVMAAGRLMEGWFPAGLSKHGDRIIQWGKTEVYSYLEEVNYSAESMEDPAYERMLAAEWENQIRLENEALEQSGQNPVDAGGITDQGDTKAEGTGGAGEAEGRNDAAKDPKLIGTVGEVIAMKPAGSVIIREKLADYDYLVQSFYSIHPTTTADRDLMNAETFLTMDLSIEKNADAPQILIYHTHSQEEFADYPENPDATIIGVGARLAELLENAGFQVIHDTTVYDVKDGTLDRSQAYTYALDGISGILQKYPSIEVVLDIHRDGVDENTKLVTEVNGKPTAKIMFFNGMSQTPDGPIEYLPNPNRDANMAFSFQMQLLAAEQYPGFTRKIYLKGLRYNQHVRARTALVEVGAQTNTYAEALNAMEPLADLIVQVLEGS